MVDAPVESGLKRLFNPGSIALVGASSDPGKISGRPISFLRRFGFAGLVRPVNPGYESMYGLDCFPSVLDLPEVPDLALITTPASAVESTLGDCAEMGVGGAILFTAGFGELSEEGAETEDRIAALCRESGLRVLGPNCQGYVNLRDRVATTFNTAFAREIDRTPGTVSWVGQSGALGGMVFDLLRRVGVRMNYWITTGNEMDLSVADCIGYVLDDPSTALVCGYVETIAEVETFRSVADRATSQGVPIVLLKGGMTPAGATAAATHTGSAAGEGDVFRAFFRQTGVTLVEDVQDIAAVAALGQVKGRFAGAGRVAIMGNSGGMNALVADHCSQAGLAVPAFNEAVLDRIRKLIPPFIKATNPIDFQQEIFVDAGRAAQLVNLLRDEAEADVFVVIPHSIYDSLGYDSTQLIESLAEAQDRGARILLVILNCQDDVVERARARGLLVFEDVGRAINALAELVGSPAATVAVPPLPPVSQGACLINDVEARLRLEEAGVPFARWRFAADAVAAVVAAAEIGPPVAVKTVAATAHKAAFGGVRLDVRSTTTAREAFQSVTDAAAASGFDPQGVIVEEMLADGLEVIVGATRKEVLGPVVMFGLGGAGVEALGDVSFRVAPFDADEARRMIEETRVRKLLSGHSHGRLGLEALAGLLVTLGDLVTADTSIQEVDLNPVLVLSDGQFRAVDAVIIRSDELENAKPDTRPDTGFELP